MKTFGLITNPLIQKYLQKANNLSFISGEKIPLFKDKKSYFLGGHKSFYHLIKDTNENEIIDLIDSYKSKYNNINCLISLPFKIDDSKLVNYILTLNNLTDSEKRFDIYEKKTRNLVRKSYKNDFNIEIGKVPNEFYKLYESSLSRLGGISKSKEWFKEIGKSLPDNIIVFSLFKKEELIAANYCLYSDKYIFLMFNVSNPDYWEYATNDRLYDELIKWAIENSFEHVDFGPGVASDDSHNHFKAGFGAKRWYILNKHYGTLYYRFKAFFRTKKHNFKIRLNKFK